MSGQAEQMGLVGMPEPGVLRRVVVEGVAVVTAGRSLLYRYEVGAECVRATVFHDGPYQSTADVEYATAGWVDRATTPAGSTPPWATSRPSRTTKPTTLPSTESRTPYRNGREPGALH